MKFLVCLIVMSVVILQDCGNQMYWNERSHCHAETTEEVCNMHSQCFLRVNLVALVALYCIGCDSVSVQLC